MDHDHDILERVTEPLRVPLKSHEVTEHASQLANKLYELDQAVLDHKERKKRMKLIEDTLSQEIEDLGEDVRTRTTTRMVDCEWQADWSQGVKYLIRTDNGDVVETVPLSEADRQRSL